MAEQTDAWSPWDIAQKNKKTINICNNSGDEYPWDIAQKNKKLLIYVITLMMNPQGL